MFGGYDILRTNEILDKKPGKISYNLPQVLISGIKEDVYERIQYLRGGIVLKKRKTGAADQPGNK